MKKGLLRSLAVLCILSLLLVSAAACKTEKKQPVEQPQSTAEESKQTEPSPKEETSAKKEFANKELDVAAFQGGYGKDYWEGIKEKFEAAYPGVKVNLTINPKISEIIRPRVVAGDPPDFIYLTQGGVISNGIVEAMIKDKGILDITDVLNEKALDKEVPLKEVILPGFLDSVKCSPYGDGKVYFTPLYYMPMGLVYNKAYFDKKGWTAPKTWDEFFALGEKAKAESRNLYTYQGIYPSYNEIALWPAIASAAGVDALQKIYNYEEGSINNENVKKVFNVFADIANKDYLMKGTVALNHTQSQTEFMMGKALFIPCGAWLEGEMKDSTREEGFEFGVMPIPSVNAGDQQYFWSDMETLYIPAKAKNPELAKEFLKFHYTDEAVKLNGEKSKGVVPVQGGVELAKSFLSASTYNFYTIASTGAKPVMGNFKTVPKGCKVVFYDEVFNPLTKVMSKKITADQWAEAVEKAMAEIRKAIESEQ